MASPGQETKQKTGEAALSSTATVLHQHLLQVENMSQSIVPEVTATCHHSLMQMSLCAVLIFINLLSVCRVCVCALGLNTSH